MHKAFGGCAQQRNQRLVTGLALSVLVLVVAGCDPEPYGDCALPRSEAIQEFCLGSGPNADVQTQSNCVVDFVFQCEEQLCATYNGSSPFCTAECNTPCSTDECPDNGTCVEFAPGTGRFYCVAPDPVSYTHLTLPTICSV